MLTAIPKQWTVMRFTLDVPCSCGHALSSVTYGDGPFSSAICPNCRSTIPIIDPLSVSVTAERLLHRSKAELEQGDYSLSIVIGTMAVEAFLTRLFLKLKGMEVYASTFNFPTAEQETEWEAESPKNGGFPRSGGFPGPADFVARAMAGITFDEFVETNTVAAKIVAALWGEANHSATEYFQTTLFRSRNRIAHWGFVNSTREEAQLCHTLAVAIVSIFREMDREKYAAL